MRSLLFVLLVACGGGTKTTPPPVTEQTPPAAGSGSSASQPMVAASSTRPTCTGDILTCALETFGYFTDQACACKDRACGDRVNKELAVWGEEMSNGPAKDTKPSPEFTTKMTELTQRYTDCVTKLYMGTTPPPDPCGGGADPCGG